MFEGFAAFSVGVGHVLIVGPFTQQKGFAADLGRHVIDPFDVPGFHGQDEIGIDQHVPGEFAGDMGAGVDAIGGEQLASGGVDTLVHQGAEPGGVDGESRALGGFVFEQVFRGGAAADVANTDKENVVEHAEGSIQGEQWVSNSFSLAAGHPARWFWAAV